MARERIVITGGAGFIAHHLIEHILRNTDWDIVVLDKLTYASAGFNRLREIGAYNNPRVSLYPVNLAQPMGECLEQEIGDVVYIAHLAAETHVDNSITGPRAFVEANVFGTFEMLEYARRLKNLKKFIYFSTDEVFGPAPDGVFFKEWDRYNSGNPYAATKAGGEELCLAWANTYKVPVIVTHCMNAFGERQHHEKFIPKVVRAVLMDETLTIHSHPDKKRAGSRFYIHCRNISDAALFVLQNGKVGEKYNIPGEQEVSNLDVALKIAEILNRQLKYEMVDFHSSRPGHDLRYALANVKLAELGWHVPKTFNESLEKTIRWMVNPTNTHWLDLK